MKFKSIHDTKRDLKEIPLFLYGNDKANLRYYLPHYLYSKETDILEIKLERNGLSIDVTFCLGKLNRSL